MPPKTRRESGDINPDVEFPVLDKFLQPAKLPSYKSDIGVLQSLTAGGKHKVRHEDAVREVAKQVYSKWYHDTVYCLHLETVIHRMVKVWDIFREGRKTGSAIDAYKALVKKKDSLYDLSAVSRSMTLSHIKEVRADKESSFRSFKEQVEAKRKLTMEWKETIKEKLAKGADMKHVVAQTKERKRLDILDELKDLGGPSPPPRRSRSTSRRRTSVRRISRRE